MRISPFLYLIGQNKFESDSKNGAKILNLFMKYSVAYRYFFERDDGKIEFFCTPYSSKKAEIICNKNNVKIEKTKSLGLPHFLFCHRKRYGLFVGIVLTFILIFLSDNYIWSINVTGNSVVPSSEVISALKDNGLYIGKKIKDIDVDKIETITLMNSERISWMSINLSGTYANVQIREAVVKPPAESYNPANIVAKEDGQVEYLEVHSGFPQVKSGSVVSKGDLLISGILDSENINYTVKRAKGKVFAKTFHDFRIEVPLEYETKRATGEKNIEKSLIFFSKEIKIFKRYRNSTHICDTIENVEMFDFLSFTSLPFGIRNVKEIYYEKDTLKLSKERAEGIAYYRLEKEIKDKLPDAIMLYKSLDFEITDESYTLTCKISCIEDIAEVIEFDCIAEKQR